MSHYALFVTGEALCLLSVAAFIAAAIDTIRHRSRR